VIQSLFLEVRIKVGRERLRKFFPKPTKSLSQELMFIKNMPGSRAKKNQGELLKLLNL